MSICRELDKQAYPGDCILYAGWDGKVFTSFDKNGRILCQRSDNPAGIQAIFDSILNNIEDPVEDTFDRITWFVKREIIEEPVFIGATFELVQAGRANYVMFYDCTHGKCIFTRGENYENANKYWIYFTNPKVSTDVAFSDFCR